MLTSFGLTAVSAAQMNAMRNHSEYQQKMLDARQEHIAMLETALQESNTAHRKQFNQHAQEIAQLREAVANTQAMLDVMLAGRLPQTIPALQPLIAMQAAQAYERSQQQAAHAALVKENQSLSLALVRGGGIGIGGFGGREFKDSKSMAAARLRSGSMSGPAPPVITAQTVKTQTHTGGSGGSSSAAATAPAPAPPAPAPASPVGNKRASGSFIMNLLKPSPKQSPSAQPSSGSFASPQPSKISPALLAAATSSSSASASGSPGTAPTTPVASSKPLAFSSSPATQAMSATPATPAPNANGSAQASNGAGAASADRTEPSAASSASPPKPRSKSFSGSSDDAARAQKEAEKHDAIKARLAGKSSWSNTLKAFMNGL